MRITLHHFALHLRTNGISAELPPGDEELLVGSKALKDRREFVLLRLLERQVGNFGPGQIANAFTQNQFTVMVDIRLNTSISGINIT